MAVIKRLANSIKAAKNKKIRCQTALFKANKTICDFLGKSDKFQFFPKKALTKPDGFDKIDAYFKSVRNGK